MNQFTKTFTGRGTVTRLGCLALLTLILAACASTGPAPPPVDPEIVAATSASDRGDFARAATLWENIAINGTPNDGWLMAADNWWLAGDPQKSKQALARLTGTRTEAANAALEDLLRGELALNDRDPVQAEFFLSSVGSALDSSQRTRLRTARQNLQTMKDDPDAALLAETETLIKTLEPVDSTDAMRILRELESVSSERLELESQKPTTMGQWAALTMDLRSTLVERKDLLQAAESWAVLNPLHPVDEQAYLELAWQYGQRFTPPGRVAVLLPTTGRLSAAGDAVRDGIVSAWLENPVRSDVSFIPITEDPSSAVQAYRAAEAQGFQWVIGPLSRESVDAVTRIPGATMPGLLLNWPSETTTNTPFNEAGVDGQDGGSPAPITPAPEIDFFSLSLSQEAEAQAVARRMLASGHHRVILLLSDSNWGERTETAFMDEFLTGGGEVVSLERFSNRDADHSTKLTQLLQIQDGRDRRRQLQGLLNLPLEFEDSRRDDFGAFFMAADPALGRQLKPQLRFFDAGSKPVFAMSRVFSGTVDGTADADLNGVVIPTTRWALAEGDQEVEFNSLRNGAFGSLHALGRDAWNLLPWLNAMSRDRAFSFPGLTGDLSVGTKGKLIRDPVWAEFRRGRPVALPEMELAEPPVAASLAPSLNESAGNSTPALSSGSTLP